MLNHFSLSPDIEHSPVIEFTHTSEQYHYRAFGLSIRSTIYFPELPHLETEIESPDVTIRYAENFESGLQDPITSHPAWQAKENAFWLRVTGVAEFLVTEGQHIYVKPDKAGDIASIRLFILGSCIGALLMQRDYFVLHGNAIQIGQHCISIVGDSGAGKSTLCAAFFKRGYSILADDVCAIDTNLQVLPSFPQIKLWKDSATHLDISTHNLRKIRPNTEKFALPLHTQYQTKSLPLCGIYQLTPCDGSQQKQETLGIQKLKILHKNTYRRQYLKGLNKLIPHHQQSANIANKIFVVEILRPRGEIQLETLIHLIENDLHEKGMM